MHPNSQRIRIVGIFVWRIGGLSPTICELGGFSRRLRQFPSSRHYTKAHRVQNTLDRIVLGPGAACMLEFCSSSIPTLVSRRTRYQLQDRYDYFKYSSHRSAWISPFSSQLPCQSSCTQVVRQCRSSSSLFSYWSWFSSFQHYYTPRVWNSVHPDIRFNTSTLTFRRHL